MDYKYIKNLSHSYELELFGYKLKDLLSLDISSKYKHIKNDYNRKWIESKDNIT